MNGVTNKEIRDTWLILGLILLFGVLSISSYSLWMDEGLRVETAVESTENGYFELCWHNLHVGLVHLMYLWSFLFGKTEFAIRTLNLPFLLIGAWYMMAMLKQYRVSLWWVMLYAVHPLTVYYMNDAGPYIGGIACACAISYHCFFASQSRTNTLAICMWLLGAFCLHFLFGIMAILYICSLIYRGSCEHSYSFIRKDILIWLCFIPLFVYVGIMYMQNVGHGGEKGWDTPGLFNLATSAYCFLGCAGLGLPRNDMRMGSYHLITPSMIGMVALLMIGWSLIFLKNIRSVWRKFLHPMIVATFVLFAVFMLFAVMTNFQFRERHVIMLFPAFLLGVIWLLRNAWSDGKSLLNRGAVVLVVGLLLVSSARIRWDKEYAKDDYKGVIAYLNENGYLNGSVPVLSQGNEFMFRYYGVAYKSPSSQLSPRQVMDANSRSPEDIVSLADYYSAHYPTVCIILNEKVNATRTFYREAERIFMEKGYFFDVITEFNTFKIFNLRRTPFSTPFD